MKAKGGERSVMLAADVGSYSIKTVTLAVQMAASMNVRLRGLFIEDEDLLQVTGLPITREISLTTARERPTDVEQMQRSMRARPGRQMWAGASIVCAVGYAISASSTAAM
jgi:hypothetical protein